MVSFFPEGFSSFDELDAYILAHSIPEGDVYKALARETREKMDQPQMMVGHLEGLFLRSLVRLAGARRILEIGTFTGYSTLAMAEALPDDGRIVTCDIDPEATAIAEKYWSQTPFRERIQLLLGPALASIENLTGPYDMVFIDADKTNYVGYWDAVVPKVRKGGLVAADNVLWSGRVLDPREADDRAIVAFNEHVAADARVEQVVLPIRDGITLAIKV